jgi:hypothetical protein
MSQYTPDRWVVLEFNHPERGVFRKLFAGWYGGWAGSDSWKLNSGITAVRIEDGIYEFDGYSGSTYRCHSSGHGMSGYMAQVLSGWYKQHADLEIKVIDLEDIVAL